MHGHTLPFTYMVYLCSFNICDLLSGGMHYDIVVRSVLRQRCYCLLEVPEPYYARKNSILRSCDGFRSFSKDVGVLFIAPEETSALSGRDASAVADHNLTLKASCKQPCATTSLVYVG
jgi:hypothetical protein